MLWIPLIVALNHDRRQLAERSRDLILSKLSKHNRENINKDSELKFDPLKLMFERSLEQYLDIKDDIYRSRLLSYRTSPKTDKEGAHKLPLYYTFDTGFPDIDRGVENTIKGVDPNKAYPILYRFKNLKNKTDSDRKVMRDVLRRQHFQVRSILSLSPKYVRSCIDLEILEVMITEFEEYFLTHKFPVSNSVETYGGYTSRVYNEYAQYVHCLIGFTVDFKRMDLLQRIIPMLKHPFADDRMAVIYERNEVSEQALLLLMDENAVKFDRIGLLALRLLHENIIQELISSQGKIDWLRGDVSLTILTSGHTAFGVEHRCDIPIPYASEDEFTLLFGDINRFTIPTDVSRFINKVIIANLYSSLIPSLNQMDILREYVLIVSYGVINNYSTERYNLFVHGYIPLLQRKITSITRYTTAYELRLLLEYPLVKIEREMDISYEKRPADAHSNVAGWVAYLYQMKSLNTDDFILRNVMRKGLLLRIIIVKIIINSGIPITYHKYITATNYEEHPAILKLNNHGIIAEYIKPDGTSFDE
jgi:hypothetical protein